MIEEIKISLRELYLETKNRLAPLGFHISNQKEIEYGVQFSIYKDGTEGIIRIYWNKKKGNKYDLSQIKDDNLRSMVENLLIINASHKNTQDNKIIEKKEPFKPIIGTDESGKGDYFGPLVTAGVFVNEKSKPLLVKLGVRDSKTISDDKIMQMSIEIKKICLNQYSIIEISPETYNNLYENIKKENKKLNTLLAWAHAKAIEDILTRVDCDNALSDKFADEKFILSKLQEKGKKITLRQEHKAENNVAVAAASIIARARFLEKLQKLSNDYGIKLLKGASQQVIDQARIIVEHKGENTLRKIAKLHFKTTKIVLDKF